MKNNHLTQKEFEEMVEKTAESRNTSDLAEKAALSVQRDREWHREHENDKAIGRDEHGNEIYKAYYVGLDVNGNDQYLFAGPGNKGFTVDSNIAIPPVLKNYIDTFDYKSLNEGEIKSVSVGIAVGNASASISYSIASNGEKFSDIKISGTLIPNVLKLDKELVFGSNYVEGTYKVLDAKGNVIKNPDIIRTTMTGTALWGGSAMFGAGSDATYSPETNCFVINANRNITVGTGTIVPDVSAGISLGKRVK